MKQRSGRWQTRLAALAAMSMSVPACLPESPDTSVAEQPVIIPGPMNGAFVSGDGLAGVPGLQKAQDIVDKLAETGVNTIIIHTLRVRQNATGPSCTAVANPFIWMGNMDPNQPDSVVERVFARAAVHGINVYVGLSYSSPCNLDAAVVAADTGTTAAAISNWLAARPAYQAVHKGWYIPDEIDCCGAQHIPFYDDVADAIRTVDANLDHKIVMSPYFGSTTSNPTTLAVAAKALLDNTALDILAVQDSVGVRNISLDPAAGGTTLEQRFSALATQLGTSNLWAVNELFTQVPYTAVGYQAASMMRLNRQLWQTRDAYASTRVGWIPQFHMLGYPDYAPHPFPDAERLRDAYRGMYLGLGQYHTISSYTWLTTPSNAHASYLDPGYLKLKDTWTGNRALPQDGRWVGTLGTATVSVNLGSAKHVSWVGASALHTPTWGIYLPTSMRVRYWTGTAWNEINSTLPVPTADDREAFLSTPKINITAQFLIVDFYNDPSRFTFLSELEIVGAP